MTKRYLASPLECLKCQLIGKGERAFRTNPEKITTIILVPSAAQVRIWALTHPQALIGSRSAVFSQLPHLKKIVVEEPENWNYKDERAPYYHAKEIAQKRAELEGLELELHYQIPRVEDLEKEKLKVPQIRPPKIVNLSRERLSGNFTFVSQPLADLLGARKNTIVYVNSRELREEIKTEIAKVGADRNTFEIFGPEIFSFMGKETDYVVWADSDTLLNLPDFRAHEKLVWTVGKLTRIAKKTVYLQTAFPQHPLFADLASGNLENFYRREVRNRKEFLFPPFATLVKLSYAARNSVKAHLEAERIQDYLEEKANQKTFLVSPPYESFSKTPGKVQLHVAVRTTQPELLAKLPEAINPDWRIEVDPESLL